MSASAVSKWSWLVLLLLAVASTGSARAGGPPIPLEEYWQQVEESHALVSSLGGESPEAAATQLTAAAEEWAAINRVSLPDGYIVTVDHSFLVSQLLDASPDLEKLESLFSAMRMAHEAWPAPRHSRDDLRTLDAILARPEFQWQETQPSLWDQLWQRIQEQVRRLLSRFVPREWIASVDAEFLGNCLTGLAALALLLILIYVGRGLLISFAPEVEAGHGRGADELLTAEAALKRAQALSTGGDYRTAVRYLYLSALLMLDEHGILRYDRSLTNREYLRTVAHLPEVSAILREVIEVFDRVWYGYQPLDQMGYEQYATRVAELRRQR